MTRPIADIRADIDAAKLRAQSAYYDMVGSGRNTSASAGTALDAARHRVRALQSELAQAEAER